MSRNYLEAFIIVLITAALGFFLVLPKYDEQKGIRQKIEEKNAEVKNRQDYYNNLENEVADLERYSEALQKVDTALPDAPDAPALMNFIQAAAMQSGLILKSVDYSGVDKSSDSATAGKLTNKEGQLAAKNSLKNYGVAVGLTGNYSNFKDFLSRIEHSSRMAEVDVIGVGVNDENSGESEEQKPKEKVNPADVILEYEIKLTANYYQRPSADKNQ